MDARPDNLNAPATADALRRLLGEAGLPTEYRLHPLAGGGNNRVFRVEAGGRLALLKVYFRHPGDPRDRLGAEFAFTRFAWGHGVRCVPQPYATDPAAGLGLYEFVTGRPLAPREVDADAVRQALAFYHELNRYRDRPEAARLPAGSEACFNLRDHLQCVERRLERLERLAPQTDLDREAVGFAGAELAPLWRQVRGRADSAARERGIALEEPLPAAARRLSPSDFGFHNVLREPSGALRFLDFEYAGWDDAAKVACDFFCQPALPAPPGSWETFLAGVTADLPRPEAQRARIELLLPAYRLKWVCIMLNDFLAAGGRRRSFARPGQDPEGRKAEQLAKARRAVGRLTLAA
jgi:hypothetical protein